ncbi:MAG TPA: hypothetical protein VN624_15130 [Rhodanobacter sp.]|nr:hypothetical protein [Rhodanobacter sp.]
MKLVQPSFTGGEISPSLYARTDLQRYANSLKTCRNMIVSAYGGCYNRPGTRFVNATKDSGTRKSRLIPFQFNNEQTYVVELGHLYARFYANGAQVVSGGSPVQVTTPYTEDDIWGVRLTQSADVMQLVHRKYPPQTLRRLSASSFSFAEYVVYEGPFQPINPNLAIKLASSTASGVVTISSNTAGVFTSEWVGRLLYMEDQNLSLMKPWTSGEKGVTVGTVRRNAGKTYRAAQLSTGGTYVLTGGNAPQHDVGAQWDGPGDTRSDGTDTYSVGVLWEYLDSGYGIVKLTDYISDSQMKGVVAKKLPSGVLGGAGSPELSWSLTGDGTTTTFSIAGNTAVSEDRYAVTIDGAGVVSNPDAQPYPKGPVEACVAVTSHLPGGMLAEDCHGRLIACVDHLTLAVQWCEARVALLSLEPCWRLESESGAWVVISKCTRCETLERGYVHGDELEGLSLPVGGDDLAFAWERIVRVTDAGENIVAKIYAGDRNYPAGGAPGRYISTHNTQVSKR